MTFSAWPYLILADSTLLVYIGVDWKSMQYQGTSTCVPSTWMFQDLFTPLVPTEVRALLSAGILLQAISRHTVFLYPKLVWSKEPVRTGKMQIVPSVTRHQEEFNKKLHGNKKKDQNWHTSWNGLTFLCMRCQSDLISRSSWATLFCWLLHLNFKIHANVTNLHLNHKQVGLEWNGCWIEFAG